jgi:hypothetical protein
MNSKIQTTTARIHILLAVSGFAVWLLISTLSTRREAWDDSVFWLIGVPLMLILNAVAGYIEPKKVVLKGIISVSLQPVAMVIIAGEIGSLFPLGLILFLFLGWVYSIGGLVGAYIKTRSLST